MLAELRALAREVLIKLTFRLVVFAPVAAPLGALAWPLSHEDVSQPSVTLLVITGMMPFFDLRGRARREQQRLTDPNAERRPTESTWPLLPLAPRPSWSCSPVYGSSRTPVEMMVTMPISFGKAMLPRTEQQRRHGLYLT